ncbi:MAG: mechanosensitive ion channel family protein [Candidatus Moranbacteria bacterium]|nr:mechanosensitive ion channel family protein [Candidatus Moranbacteria bacterium]
METEKISQTLFGAPIWQESFFGNSLEAYAIAFGVFIILLGLFRFFQYFLIARVEKIAKKTETNIDDALLEIVQSIKPPFYLVLAIFLSVQPLAMADFVSKGVEILSILVLGYQVVTVAQILIGHIARKGLKADENPTTQGAVQLITRIARGVLWVLVILTVLSNLGVNVTSLIAGLGIGGIAVALAVQGILSDLLSSFSIYFDKPFEIGDFIVVGSHMGTVEKVGFKTTRIRSLGGEQIIMPNQGLTSTRVQNYKRMQRRRVVFHFGVTYQTPTEKLKNLPQTVKEIIENVQKATFDRAHWSSFDDSALTFEVVYYVESPDYNEYMDVQQKINIDIKKSCDDKKIDFAYPTQTIHMAQRQNI